MQQHDIEKLIEYMEPHERAQLDALLEGAPIWNPLPGPQAMAFDSEADIIGFGGAAGGGKSDLAVGLAVTKHQRCVVIRREKAQTEGMVQRIMEIVGGTAGYNSQKSIWRVPAGTQPLIEFGGLDNMGDESRWQGRAHDLKVFDEVTECREAQVRFIMGWTRTSAAETKSKVLMTFNPPTSAEGRWVLEFFAPWLDPKHPRPAAPGELRWFTTIEGKDTEVPDARQFVLVDGQRVYDFDPLDHRLENIITPKSRTFIPSRVTDNPYYVNSGYLSTLQALPEPLRSQMLYGDFNAGIEDDPWQVIPTKWVEIAMARWRDLVALEKLPPMSALGVDVARGGRDQTVIAARHGMWFNRPVRHAGSETPNGPKTAGLIVAELRDDAPILIDVIGVGSSPYDYLRDLDVHVLGVNVAEASHATAQGGRLSFFNQRSEYWWKMREALDPANNTGIALPPDKQLLADLTAPKWEPRGPAIKVESREEIVKRLGRSPDTGTAYILALKDVPKRDFARELERAHAARTGARGAGAVPYDPFQR